MAEARSNGRSKDGVLASARTMLRTALLLAATAPMLGACGASGFQPLHGSASVGGPAVSEKLAQLEISTIPGRVGPQIRNELIYQSTGGGLQAEPKYRLDIAIRESLSSTLVTVEGDARSQIYNLDAVFKLVRLSDKAVVLEGKSFQRAAFERFTSVFSNVRAREDAENRAAKAMGDELKTRIAAYLATTA